MSRKPPDASGGGRTRLAQGSRAERGKGKKKMKILVNILIAEGLISSLTVLLTFTALLLILLWKATRGWTLEMRHLPGLDAIDEAVGRAAEMGRPIVSNPGLGGLRGGPVTIAGLSVVTHISRLAARNGAKLIVPVSNPELLPVVYENVRESYLLEGVPEDFNPEEQIRWLSPNQFSWTAALQGIAEREKVASNVMIGAFAAEAMILAETFARVGAFQVGGLTNTYQIPFFVAACDYTLIRDEMLAAGAYLSKDPEQIATIGAEDVFKLIFVVIIIVGSILAAFGNTAIVQLLGK
ncbi:MAG: DUF6754 domain-containing protein [Candidatus Bathyarchaeia archaeon]